jgi:hypothetical protein
MKPIVLLCLLPLPLWAGAPKKPLPSRYTTLHTSSPFTTPAPPVVSNVPVVNPLEDWTLGGVTKFPDGYFVILMNKKKPEEKTIIQPGQHSEFEVLEVEDGGMDYTATTVKLKYGSSIGTVSFDKKLLTVKTPDQGQPGQQQQNRPTGFPPTVGGERGGDRGGDRGGNQPRLRTIVPPSPSGTPVTPGQMPQLPQR